MTEIKYTCPMHPEIISDKPGRCPICGMDLVAKGESAVSVQQKTGLQTYQPLIVIIGMIFLTALAASFSNVESNNFSWVEFMPNFMAGFFLVFGSFKLLDLKGFASAYLTYDLLAGRWSNWGYIYPFVEIALGFAYLLRLTPDWLHFFTFILMAFSGLGVVLSLAQKRQFQCACLGTIIKVPLTKVTIIEDFGMSVMALLSLIA
jgi:hypothetical protein